MGCRRIERLGKVEEILLITEDGVEIKRNDWVFSVRTKYKEWATTETCILTLNQVTSDFGWKHFSSPMKRKEYIKWNEPRFSLDEVKSNLKRWNIVIPYDVLYLIVSDLNDSKFL